MGAKSMTSKNLKAVIKRHRSGVIEPRELKRYYVFITTRFVVQYVTSTRNTEDMINTLLEIYKDTLVKSPYGYYVPANIRIVKIDKDGPALLYGRFYGKTIKIPGGRKLIILSAA